MKRISLLLFSILGCAALWAQIEIKSSYFEQDGVAEGEMHFWSDTLYVYDSYEFEILKFDLEGSYLGRIKGPGLQFLNFQLDPKSGEIIVNQSDGVYKLSHNGTATAISELAGLNLVEIFIWKDSVHYLCNDGSTYNRENGLKEVKFIDKHSTVLLKGISAFDGGLVFRWFHKVVVWEKTGNQYKTYEIDKEIPITDYAKYAFIDKYGWIWVGSGSILYYFDGNKWQQVFDANNPLSVMLDAKGNAIFMDQFDGYISRNKQLYFRYVGNRPGEHVINGLNYDFFKDHYRTWDGNAFKTFPYKGKGPVNAQKERITMYKIGQKVYMSKQGVIFEFDEKGFVWSAARSVKDYVSTYNYSATELSPLEDGRTLIRLVDRLSVWNPIKETATMLFNIPFPLKTKHFYTTNNVGPIIEKGNEIGYIENNGYRWLEPIPSKSIIDTIVGYNMESFAFLDGYTGKVLVYENLKWQITPADDTNAAKGMCFDNEGDLVVYYDNYFRYVGNNLLEFKKIDKLNAFSKTSVWLLRNDSLFFYNGNWYENISQELDRTFETVNWLQSKNERSVWVQDSEGLHLITLPIPTDVELPRIVQLEVFPNPCEDIINIPGQESSKFIIFNTQGWQVLDGQTKGSITIGTLPKGIYFLQLDNGEKRLQFVKN